MKKLLIVRFGAMGDLIHMSGTLRGVIEAYPDTEIHVLTSHLYQPMVESFEGVTKVWGTSKSWGDLMRVASQLRDAGIEGLVNLHPSLKTLCFAWQVLGITAFSHQKVYVKEKLRIRGRNQRLMKRRHAVEDFYEPFKRLLHLPEKTVKELTPQLSVAGNDHEEAYTVALIPGVGPSRSNRAWSLEAYDSLIQKLLVEPACRIVLIGGEDERVSADSLARSPRVENHCGKHSILETASILSSCKLVIGGDTGPLHLAAAVGANVLGVYGPTSASRTGPVGGIAIQTPPESLECWPCEYKRCHFAGDSYLACMKQIDVEAVYESCQRILLDRCSV